MMERAKLWWERMFGPARALQILSQAYQGESRSLVVTLPADVSYLTDLRAFVKQEWRIRHGGALEVLEFDCSEHAGDLSNAILDVLAERRPLWRKGLTLADLIKNEGLLCGKVLWLKGIDEKTCGEALRLAQGYSRSGKPGDGFILLELRSSLRPKKFSLKEVLLAAGETDIETFATHLFRERYAEEDLRPYVFRYLAYLASSLLGTDAELVERFSAEFDYKTDDPVALVRSIMTSGVLSAERGSGTCAGENRHIFSLLQSGEEKEIEKRIWRAQIRAVFPLLEDIRRTLIDRYRDFWQDCLDAFCVKDMDPQEPKRITSPEQLELAQLNFCLHKAVDASAVSAADYKHINFLPDQRNALAHLETLGSDAISRVFEIAKEFDLR